MPPRLRRVVALALAAVLLGACGDDDDATAVADDPAETTTTTASPTEAEGSTSSTAEVTTTTATTLPAGADQLIEVAVAGDSVQNGGRHEVSVGDTVAITVTTDRVDEIHVHGYDVYADIGPDAPTTFLVEATIPGVWEVELHDSGLLLLELAVS